MVSTWCSDVCPANLLPNCQGPWYDDQVRQCLAINVFYSNYGEKNIELGKWGVKAVEMEAAALYYLAAQHHVDALAIMTISDSLVNPDEDTTAEERQNTFTDMMKVGLETLIAD